MAERGQLEQAVQKRIAPHKEPPKPQGRSAEHTPLLHPEEPKVRPPVILQKVDVAKDGAGSKAEVRGHKAEERAIEVKIPAAGEARGVRPSVHWASGEARPLQRKKSQSANEPHVLNPRHAAGEKTQYEAAFAQAGKATPLDVVQRESRTLSAVTLPLPRPSSSASSRSAQSDEERRIILEEQKSSGSS